MYNKYPMGVYPNINQPVDATSVSAPLVKPIENQLYSTVIPDKFLQLSKTDPELRDLNKYNTPLDKDQYARYLDWAKKKKGGEEGVLYEMGGYDLQGYFKKAEENDMKRKLGIKLPESEKYTTLDNKGHGTDLFKKPSHISFSNESMYHTPENYGGEWSVENGKDVFYPSKKTIENYGLDNLRDYFKKHEPNVQFMYKSPIQKYKKR